LLQKLKELQTDYTNQKGYNAQLESKLERTLTRAGRLETDFQKHQLQQDTILMMTKYQLVFC